MAGLLAGLGIAHAAIPRPADFTAAQVATGARIYAQHCAACHGANLNGGAAPALADASFQAQWAWPRRSLLDLLTYTRTNMPLGAAGSLPQADYLSVLAFMLRENGQLATGQALADDRAALVQMAFASGQVAAPAPPPRLSADFTAGAHGPVPRATGPSQAELADAAQRTDWLMSNKDFSGDRTSSLQTIDTANAAQIRKLCSISLKPSSRAQTSPVVYNGVLYVTSGLSTAAIDAVSCKLRWQYDWPTSMPGVDAAANRGVAIKDGRVIRGTADGHLLALDAADGSLLWARRVSNPIGGELITMQPLIYDDLIFIGPAVSEFGIRGWIGAFRLSDGAPVWRFDIVPKPGTSGAETWAANPTVRLGGGSVWNALAIDAAREILFVPTANPAPDFAASLRGGDNLYTNAVLALHLRTGALAWYRQIRPHDDHDWDVTQVSPLYRATIDGKARDLLAQTGKDGQLRVFDRDSHAQMFATPLTTIKNPDVPVTEQGVDVCPGVLGGVQWNGAAYLPSRNLLVAPAVDWCSRYTLDHDVTFIPFQTYLGGQSTMIPPASGWLTALDASTGQVKWRYHGARPMIAGVTTTAGGLVLTGELTGDVLALDADNGRILARLPTGGQLGAGIVTYQVDGRQYIAAATGTPSAFWVNPPGGAPGITVFGLLDRP
jgi:alcohol dehydrogenase (cytochrome c)